MRKFKIYEVFIMFRKFLKVTLLPLMFFYSMAGVADVVPSNVMDEVKQIQTRWAQLYYLSEYKNKNYRELQELARNANRLSSTFPDSAEALTWDGIVLSTRAEKKGGVGALSLVREALLKLEAAEQINPTVLDGSIFASLATLYSKVPGWPLSFGNDKKARYYFKKALEVNPDGLDINYFYAEYLTDSDEDALALEYVEKALNAPVLISRPVADKGRRQQAMKLREMLISS